jgi:hypothetical protein
MCPSSGRYALEFTVPETQFIRRCAEPRRSGVARPDQTPKSLTTPATPADSGRMAEKHQPDNQEDREVYSREHNAGGFIDATNNVNRDSVDTTIMSVKAFAGEPEVLYVALDYAYHCGVSVTMA